MLWDDYFVYDETVPSCLRWKKSNNKRIIVGTEAGCMCSTNGYYLVGVEGSVYRAHRVIYEMLVEPIGTGKVIDHIDGDTTNNRINNLRCVPDSALVE